MEISENIHILQQIKNRYRLGSLFGLEYLKRYFKPDELSNLDLDNLAISPLNKMWFDFGLTTNIRGEGFYEEIAPYLPKSGKRYLDVGCGFGGFMVAFHNHGYQVAGLDINPELVNLSMLNLKDHGVDGPVLQADILTSGLKENLGSFDVISCYDVIEHVDNASVCLEKLIDFLNPNGMLGLKIPNKDCIKFVTSDGHYNLFGITLLPHDLASKYHQSLFPSVYTVGEYYPLSFYTQKLKNLGCSIQIIEQDQYLPFWQAPPLIIKLILDYRKFKKNIHPSLPSEVSKNIIKNYRSFMSKMLTTLFIPFNIPSFREHFLTDFWTIIAIKK